MTYSIVAIDLATGEMGGAGTSCLAGGDVFVIYGGVPDHGVVHAQAYYDARARDHAAQLLSAGNTAQATLRAITQPTFDADVAIRQYGIVDVGGNAVGFTGPSTLPFAADRQGQVAGLSYSVQGNSLTSSAVLEQTSAAFEAGGCDLAERLMRGLLAGAENGEGDSRCTDRGIPSDSAFLRVERQGGREGDHLSLRVESSGEANPLPLLQQKLAQWRTSHPCPEAPIAAESSDVTESGGCGCRFHPHGSGDAWLAGLLLGLFVFRRVRAATRQVRPRQLA